ncbi:AraC family transcriptional regulator [Kitasatospora sp. NPDC101183]|uniref:helix-turn-helix transcriptional regulator n=1 Tax=Kitasatospora sp. NPDC101183 TaxID=3364100 RepID=UPI00380C5471
MDVRKQGVAEDCGLSGEERFEQWRELLLRTRMCETSTPHVESFTAEIRRSELGPVTVFGTSFPSARFRRTERMVRQADEYHYHVTLLTAGALRGSFGRGQVEAHDAGDIVLTSSQTAYDSRYLGLGAPCEEGGGVAGVGIDLPVSLVPIPPERLRVLLGRGINGRRGTGALLADFLVGLDRRAAELCPAERARLGAVAVDLVSAWIARELDAESALSPDARDRTTVEGVRSFIRRNLHDPDLAPPVVADAHHISVSHLHRLFTQYSHGQTVASYIRSQRMAKAHRDLVDPALGALPIHAVAARCGLLRASDFCRAFKAAYGLTPREHRRGTVSGPIGRAMESAESTTD